MKRDLCTCGQTGAAGETAVEGAQCKMGIRTVSHTLEGHLAERLRLVSFHERVSESAVIEYALSRILIDEPQNELGRRLREAGATLRRKGRRAGSTTS
jgi:hypothetical protein